ncbi:MAG TPA: ATPase domain-containing protein [Oligoflexus sp.]|uniref:ATPase domain-containing protein n=1 Tax=Oligoflexus sp. TaxID=1971216 RepID=UPI002D805FC8|nr:ATPase domain-containing protein [Oligoflexus sp.]HET9239371.1 ATPase domain-containing protein [Oligoflexus sp.]
MTNPDTRDHARARIHTGVPGLDTILCGGLPRGSFVSIGGPPGSGKTIMSHQIGFFIASPECKVMYFQTLSEPTAKRLRFLKEFSYFDPDKIDREIFFIDLGEPLRMQGLDAVLELLIEHVKRERPSFVVVDSFKAFGDFVTSPDQFRRFSYEVVVRLMAWECAVLLLGEFADADFQQTPIFSVIDGLIVIRQQMVCGEQRRILQVVKMRGTDHSREPHTFKIHEAGIHIYAPRLTIRRDPNADTNKVSTDLCKFGLPAFDELLNGGIPRGFSLLVSGVAGTGKTATMLEFIYRGARQFGEKGLYISFEETMERIHANARGFGWDIAHEIERGMIEIIFIPQPDVRVEEDLDRIQEAVKRFKPDRVAVDSLSVFLDKVESSEIMREKVFQLATIFQAAGAVALLATNIPYGQEGISRCSVEETVVDGVILLSSDQIGMDRERFIEIFKLRNTAHVMGRHKVTITRNGLAITLHRSRTRAVSSSGANPAVKSRASASGKKSNGISKKKSKSRKV